MNLTKYHGLGNDYLVYDPNREPLPLTEARVRLICHRNYGVGSDGILYGPILSGGEVALRIFNPDGSEAEKSGNGIRIFAKYLLDEGYVRSSFVLHTLGGDVDVEYLDPEGHRIKAMMGRVTFQSGEIPVAGRAREIVDEAATFAGEDVRITCLSVGNPHCVIPMADLSPEKACQLGSIVETDPRFPNRINMQLLRVRDRGNIEIEIFERGAGYTLASGSSSCAAACAAHRLGLADSEITVHMPGGQMQVSIQPDWRVYLTGTVDKVGVTVLDEAFVQALVAMDDNAYKPWNRAALQ